MTRVQAMMGDWLRHRAVLPDILGRVDAEKVDFAPWEGALTLGKLAVHMVTSTHFFLTAIQTGEFTRAESPAFTTMDDVKRIVQEYTDASKKVYESLTDDQLNEILDASFMGMKAPKLAFLSAMKDHEVHHKGQMFVYARMAGATEMPFFISRG
ncbi:MAG: DinB family protein [Firmicutes bacterium]|nr:DinB family protein [Bacillota bacterium]